MTPEIAILLREGITLAREAKLPIAQLEAWSNWADAAEDALERNQPKETK